MSRINKIIIGLFISLLVLGCSSNETAAQDLEPKLVIGKSLEGLILKDQHEKAHTLSAETKTLIFAFSKDMGHSCNDFFDSKNETYLSDNSAIFIADVSSAPSIIRSMFIMPGLKDFKHTVLVLDDENIAAAYKTGMDTQKIVLVSVKNSTITKISTLGTVEEMATIIESN